MILFYSFHARQRLKQRGITPLEVRYVLNYPKYIQRSYEGRMIAVGEVQNREIRVIYIERENFIKIITIL